MLRPLKREDLPLTLGWRNDVRSRRWFVSDVVIAPEAHLAWFEGYLARDDDIVFILEAGGQPVAQAALYRIRGDSAEFGRLLVDPVMRGRGYGVLASRLCMRVADDQLKLRQVRLEVKADNHPAVAIYRSLGFQEWDQTPSSAGLISMVRSR